MLGIIKQKISFIQTCVIVRSVLCIVGKMHYVDPTKFSKFVFQETFEIETKCEIQSCQEKKIKNLNMVLNIIVVIKKKKK